LDIGNVNEIREDASYELVDGITTDPSPVSKEDRECRSRGNSVFQQLTDIGLKIFLADFEARKVSKELPVRKPQTN
jgi:transaldolase